MKVDYITNLRLPSTKANCIQIMQNSEAFKKAGVDITLWAPFRFGTKKEKRINNIWEYYSVDKKFAIKRIFSIDLFPLLGPEFLWFLIQSFSFYLITFFRFLLKKTDVIYTRDAWLGLSLFYKKNKVLELHNYPQSKIGRSIYKFLLRRFSKVIVISKGLKEEVHHSFVAPDGVKIEAFKLDLSRDQARKQLGIEEQGQIVMYSGSLQRWKGVHVLLEAMQDVRATLYLVGSTLDKKEMPNFPDCVVSTGHIPHKDIPLYLKASDVLVIPNTGDSSISAKYTSPLKAFEYMASGKAIVVSDLPSMLEIFDNNNSYIFKAGNPTDLADKIQDALLEGAKQVDASPYSWDTRVKKIIDYIK